MIRHRANPQQQGFSMLEVLIAILVFSLGVIGLAGLLIFSIRSNHVAYLRTQATFLAHNMANRMGANPAGLWSGDYDASYPATASTVSCASGCSPAELARYDRAMWSSQLRTFLPQPQANIACDASSLTFTPGGAQVGLRPPYGGTCRMTVSWNEASAATGAQQRHTFAWVFQP